MKLRAVLASAAVALTMSSTAFAEKGAPGSGPNPFSDCGIGAAIFENNVAAAISNVIWDVGTTAVTSATASPETCNGKEVEAAAFIFESYDNLMEDGAHGEGEHFAALMEILEVQAENHSSIMEALRQDMAEQSALQGSKVEKAEALYSSVMKAVSA